LFVDRVEPRARASSRCARRTTSEDRRSGRVTPRRCAGDAAKAPLRIHSRAMIKFARASLFFSDVAVENTAALAVF